jgi:hypothetical protein
MSGGEYPHPEGGGCGELCILLMAVEMLDIYILFMTVDAVETMLAASHCLAARLPFPPATSVNLTIKKD